MIQVNYRDPRPIYEQIRDAFGQQIAAGILQPGDQLPSVRELASRLAINPNTIQRAYRELEAAGYIHSVRGKGNFVADFDGEDPYRQELLSQFDELVQKLEAIGISGQDLARRIERGGADGRQN